jgi:cytochrome b subunit of formate dehydrogenase
VRVSHWLNVVCLIILLMSGLQILNAHPALYWGDDSDFSRPWLSISSALGVVAETLDERGVASIGR